jgi:hypothetical protein
MRGSAVITADGREIPVRYTNRALAEAEAATGMGIVALLQGFMSGTTGVAQIAHLLQVGMEAARKADRLGGTRLTLEDAYQVLDAAGFATVAALVMTAAAEVLSYDGVESADPNA